MEARAAFAGRVKLVALVGRVGTMPTHDRYGSDKAFARVARPKSGELLGSLDGLRPRPSSKLIQSLQTHPKLEASLL